MSEWLEKLKVGDEVAVDSGLDSTYITKVARLTATLIVTEKGGRFRRSDGFAPRTGGYERRFLQEATEEIRDSIAQRHLARILREVQWKDYSLDNLRAVFQLLKK